MATQWTQWRQHDHLPTHLPAHRRSSSRRAWIWCFLVLNLVAICGVTMFSAVVFVPQSGSSSVVRLAIKQGDSWLLEPHDRRVEEQAVDAFGGDDQQQGDGIPAFTVVTLAPTHDTETLAPAIVPTIAPYQEQQQRLRGRDPQPTNKQVTPVAGNTDGQRQPAPKDDELLQLKQETDIANGVQLLTVDTDAVPVTVSVTPAVAITSTRKNVPTTATATAADPATDPATDLATDKKTSSAPATSSHVTFPPSLSPSPSSSTSSEAATTAVTPTTKATTIVMVTKIPVTAGLRAEPETNHHGLDTVETGSPVHQLPTTQANGHADRQTEDGVADGAGATMESDLVLWLDADTGVDVEDHDQCLTSGTSCEVVSWKSQAKTSFPVVFTPRDKSSRPQYVPRTGGDSTHATVAFSCPLTSHDLVLHEISTLFFVLEPSHIQPGDTYRGQKFFGTAPYGQFLLHGGRPAFYTTGGLRESDSVVHNTAMILLVYRLRLHSVEIKVNDGDWSEVHSDQQGGDGYAVRLSVNVALSLGSVKSLCDTNAFQGRIAEVLVYDTALSNERVAGVETYLREKWWGSVLPTADEKRDGGDILDKLDGGGDDNDDVQVNAHVDGDTDTDAAAKLVADVNTDEDAIVKTKAKTDGDGDPDIYNHIVDKEEATGAVLREPHREAMGEVTSTRAVATTDSPVVEDKESPLHAKQAAVATDEETPQQEKQDVEPADDTHGGHDALPALPDQPRTFNPEGVFEWVPSDALLAEIARTSDSDVSARKQTWATAVQQRVASIRNYQLGGAALHTFIREHRDHLLALRQELFG